jgi:peptidoglycan/LPS O-acetylase OafA/YrhL
VQTGYLKQIFIDGWFPVFPWIGFALLGALIAKLRWANNRQNLFDTHLIWVGSLLLIALGTLVWINHPGALYIRLGFSELFYPPTSGYNLTAIGIVALLFWIADKRPDLKFWRPVKIMGQSALFLYILHWIIIDHVIDRFAQQIKLKEFFLWYLLLLSICFAIAYASIIVRKKWHNMPAAVKLILG